MWQNLVQFWREQRAGAGSLMESLEFLEPQRHAQLAIRLDNAASRQFVQIVADEFTTAMVDYPILFTKHQETGAFYPGVMMGLEVGDNLLARDGVLAGYRPADLVRQGFYVRDSQIAINMEDSVFAPAGEALFDASLEPAPALRRVQQALQTLDKGLPETAAIIARFVESRLVEPIDISLNFDDGSRLRLEGLYSISLDALHALPDSQVLELFRRGDLQLAYAQTMSLQHIRRLAKIRNDRMLATVA
jgi:hypothetical protein